MGPPPAHPSTPPVHSRKHEKPLTPNSSVNLRMFKSGSIKLKYLVWAAMAIVSLVVIGGGIAKLMGVEMVLASFATLGLPAISGTFIGLCEIAGGIGIWFRRTSKYAAGGLAIIMLGAIYYHVLHTPIMESLVAFIILLICGYIVKRRGTGIIG